MKEAVTKVIDTLTQEDIHGPSRSCWNDETIALQQEEIASKGTRILCVYYQYKCPYEKSQETYLMIFVNTLIYIHIYIYIYIYIIKNLRQRLD